MEIVIRHAVAEDMNTVANFIQELAKFEDMAGRMEIDAQCLVNDGFKCDPPAFLCKMADVVTSDGAVSSVGYALYFPKYSSKAGQAVMLEDLYVQPEFRNKGVGGQLFDAVVNEARENGWKCLEWHVLSWNPATNFYLKRGGQDLTHLQGRRYYRLEI